MDTYKQDKSTQYNDMLKGFLAGGVHHNFYRTEKDFISHIVRGKGSRLWDMDGNEYLDLYARAGAMILGHDNQEYIDALKNCLDCTPIVDLGDLEYDVCRLINKYIPCADMMRFGLSGTEMVQNALRVARAYTGKNRFVRFEGHYHGHADNILGGWVYNRDYPVPEDRGDGVVNTKGRARNIMAEQSFLLPWNDMETLENIARRYGDDIAAIIMEPILVNGGGILPVPGYLEQVRDLCTGYNIVLIFDEVITGFRVGLGGAQTLLGVTPDLAVFSKCIAGGGVPVSVLTGKREVMQLYEKKEVVHAGTFNGYQLGLAAIKTTIEILGADEGKCLEVMCSRAAGIHQTMIEAARAVGLPLVVQGHPSCASFHCSERPITDHPDDDVYMRNTVIRNRLASNGIFTTSLSKIYPNISITDDDVAFFKARVGSALEEAKMIITRLSRKSVKSEV